MSRFRRRTTGPLLAAFAIALAVPTVREQLTEIAELAAGTTCCDDGDCNEAPGHACPRPCAHCGCPSQPTMVSLSDTLVRAPFFASALVGSTIERVRSSDHRAPPFRPPAV